eukprot:c21021_g1_i1 orf=336-2687(+)
MDFNELESSEGLRWSWHTWPNTRKESVKMVIPLGIMCTPLLPLPDLPRLSYDPLLCRTCRGVLNSYCRVDFHAKVWNCCFCYQRNSFPPSYSSISENNLPAELFPTYTSVEYVFPRSSGSYTVSYPSGRAGSPSGGGGISSNGFRNISSKNVLSGSTPTMGPGFIFVLDTCVTGEDLRSLKNAIMQTLSLLPENALVGLVSFGTMVYVHELGYTDCSKVIAFNGERDSSTLQVKEMLGISSQQPQSKGIASRFMVPISECEFSFTTALEELQPNPFAVEPGHRPCRATGSALAISACLTEGCNAVFGARIMLFVAGPATIGPGMVVETDLEKSIRTHQDLVNGNAPFYKKACDFYKNLAQRLTVNGLVLDIFACSLDQVGIDEARPAIESSGGVIVLAETFDSDQFKKSLQQLFVHDKEGNLEMFFNTTLEVITTQDVKLCGAIGPCSSLKKRATFISENEVGIGGTSLWKMNTITNKTCIAFYFEIAGHPSSAAQPGSAFFIQFLTKYQHSSGLECLRVTTSARRWIDGAQLHELAAGFDQETAAAIVARLAVFKTQKEDVFDILRWLDRMLIRFSSKFGDYVKEDPASFRLSSNLSLYPQFIFYLRRSQFLQVFNNTPDETSFFRLMLNREGVVGSVIMIQPTLISYSFDGPPVAVLLDVSSIHPNCILLFDSYFYVVVHYGSVIAQWRNLGYQNDPTYENLKKFLEAPLEDAQALLKERVPVPKLIECDQHGSQARFLLAKLNPSITHNSDQVGESEVIFTDDVSLQVFIAHLQKLAVQD